MFTPLIKSCDNCGKQGTSRTSVCSGCHMVRYCSAGCSKSHWKTHKVSCLHLYQFSKVRHQFQDGTAEAAYQTVKYEGITPENKEFCDYMMLKTTKNHTIRELYKKWEDAEKKFGPAIEQAKEAERLFDETGKAVAVEITKKVNA